MSLNVLLWNVRARAQSLFCTYRSAWTVLYMNTVFFLLIDRLVCTIQGNQLLDELIKYVALYHILYRGQLKIRLSVHVYILYNRAYTIYIIME